MMKVHRGPKTNSKESGQTAVFLVLVLGLFLLGAVAFSVDISGLWFARQMAQGTADSACTAAAMDMLYTTTGVGSSGGFTAGTNFSCGGTWDTAAPSSSPCVYAAKNMGSSASSLAAGTQGYDVHFTFPSSVPGLPTCTTGKGAPPICNGPGLTNNFIQVNVDERVPLFFAAMLSGSMTTDVGAQATCGVVDANAPIPLLILNPTLSGTLNVSGTGNQAKITISGGPQRSIQVNSSNATAFNSNGNPIVDLSKGGPNNTGSDIGVTASESLTTSGITYQNGTTGQWKDPQPPISDPFAQLPVPKKPGTNGTVTAGIAGGTNGCPTGTTCTEYSAGYYSGGISVKGSTAIFDPGVYYLDGDFTADANSCLRPSTAVGDSSGGSMFYFNTGTIQIDSNSGKNCSASISTTTGSGSGQLQYGVLCTSNSKIPGNLPTTITGNLLMAPCTGPYGDPLLLDDPIGEQHGILLFSNRSSNLASVKPKDQPKFGGGGTAAALGSLYFHYCNSPDGAGLGTNCPSTAYTDQITLQGVPGSTSYVVGDIVTDELGMGGTPDIVMDLNPTALYYVLTASLLQ